MDLESSFELVKRAQGGDREALNRLLSRYIPRLRQWASHRLPAHARDLCDTDDLVQDAVIGSVLKLDAFAYRGEGALQAYLRKAVLNRLLDEVRRVGRRPERDELPATVAADAPSPLEAAIGREAIDRYDAALERLSDVDRQAVVLRAEFGYGFQEIADMLGKPSADAARMAVGRAIETLAGLMAEVASVDRGSSTNEPSDRPPSLPGGSEST